MNITIIIIMIIFFFFLVNSNLNKIQYLNKKLNPVNREN